MKHTGLIVGGIGLAGYAIYRIVKKSTNEDGRIVLDDTTTRLDMPGMVVVPEQVSPTDNETLELQQAINDSLDMLDQALSDFSLLSMQGQSLTATNIVAASRNAGLPSDASVVFPYIAETGVTGEATSGYSRLLNAITSVPVSSTTNTYGLLEPSLKVRLRNWISWFERRYPSRILSDGPELLVWYQLGGGVERWMPALRILMQAGQKLGRFLG